MYDLNFENKLIEIKNNSMIRLDNHIEIVANEIERSRNDVKKIIDSILEFSKEGKGIKIGKYPNYHIYKRKEHDRVIIAFRNPIEQRFFDVSDFDEYYKGVIIQNPDSEEIVTLEISHGDERTNDFSLRTTFIKGIQAPTGYYHSHRGTPQICYGNILDETLTNIRFSFAQTMNSLLEGLRRTNFDDTIAHPITAVNELCFFGYNFSDSMSNLTLENKLYGALINRATREELRGKANSGFYSELKKRTTHSYHKDCYCYYCTSIHLIKMDRDRIVFDDLSRVIVTKEEFDKALDKCGFTDKSRAEIIEAIEIIKNKNFTTDIEVELGNDDDDSESVSDYLYDNLSEYVDRLCDYYQCEIDECKDFDEKIDELDNKLDTMRQDVKDKKSTLMGKPITKRMGTIDFLLGDDIERNNEEVIEVDESEYDGIKEEISELEEEISHLENKHDNMRDDLTNYNNFDLYEYTNGNYSEDDIRSNYDDRLYEWASEDYSHEDETEYCSYDSHHQNRESRGFHQNVQSIIPYGIDSYEHYEINANGELTDSLWKEKIESSSSTITNNLGELYIKQHGGMDMDKIRNTVTTIVGCGTLGSNIAYTMSRIGYRIFGLIDFDKVVLHNLPNQYFMMNQIGDSKTKALQKNLLNVLPNTAFPIIFDFDTKIESYRMYNGDIPTLLNNHTDIFIMATDNLESRHVTTKYLKELSYETARNFLVIDVRMNDLNSFVVYSYYMRTQRDRYDKHLATMLDTNGELIKLEDENVCGLQSSILVAQKVSLTVNDILHKHLNGEEIPYLTTNLF